MKMRLEWTATIKPATIIVTVQSRIWDTLTSPQDLIQPPKATPGLLFEVPPLLKLFLLPIV